MMWTPPADVRETTQLGRYLNWLRETHGIDHAGYDELWRWSVDDLEGFWGSIWDWCEVQVSKPYERVLGKREMPGAEWFPGAELNYAEHSFRMADDGRPAIVQDTGWSAHLPTGTGLLPFSTPEEAIAALARVSADWATHSRRASEIAREHFDASVILPRLIEVACG